MGIWNAVYNRETPPPRGIPAGQEGVYIVTGRTDELPDETGLVVWHELSGKKKVVNLEAYKAIRPFGNESGTGAATGPLYFTSVMGHGPRELTDDGKLYPEDDEPFVIEIRHKEFTGNANPAWDGWGWRAEILNESSTRDPSARAIAIYSDEACTQYLYTTGAFTEQQSMWQVDSNDNPITVWATEYNPGLLGYNNDEKADVHHACLLGAAQEGFATLRAGQESAVHYFWSHTQGQEPPAGATWVDSGLTVIAPAGALYRLSGVPTLVNGQAIRLGDTSETTFTGYWPTPATPSDTINISPYVSVPVGTKLYIWQ
jgi:hypothetical protein